MEIVILLAMFCFNYNYSRSEMYKMCKDQKTKSEYCKSKIQEVEKAQKNLEMIGD